MRIIYVTFKKKNWTQVDAIYVIAIDQTDHYNSGVDYFNVDRFVANSARIDSFCFDLKFPKRKISKALIRYGGFFDRLGQMCFSDQLKANEFVEYLNSLIVMQKIK